MFTLHPVTLWVCIVASCASSEPGEFPLSFAQMAASVIIILRNTHQARHIAALLVPVWRVNEGGAVWLIKDWSLRPLVRRRPLP
jgi:hypothetical protein